MDSKRKTLRDVLRLHGKTHGIPTDDLFGEESERVDLIASGYEWICPNCEKYNREIESKEHVTCGQCGKTFETNPPEHAYG